MPNLIGVPARAEEQSRKEKSPILSRVLEYSCKAHVPSEEVRKWIHDTTGKHNDLLTIVTKLLP